MDYDLEERLTRFGENIVDLCKKIPKNEITLSIVDQLIRCGTGTGANYTEANGASSKKDFKNKIYIAKKEIMETKYWLRILAKADKNFTEECRGLWKEAHELTLILSKIATSAK